MGFVKVVKTPAYFKRYQVKFTRRRQAKTDYYARQRLITQDKNKYKTPKYRLVVRITNRDVICQIFSADLTHDVCVAAAYSHELPRYGIALGLTNYAAAYATGLLLARRVNKKFNLDYEGNTEIDGTDYNVDKNEEGAAPFRALLDVGLARTTTGARIFGALKGACDGGIDVPHKDRRFPGSKRGEGKEWESDPEVHRKYIFGGHVAEYMRQLKEGDEDKQAVYARQFKRFVERKIGPDQVEGIYTEAHKAIRADPFKKRDAMDLGFFKKRKTAKPKEVTKKKFGQQPISVEQRKNRIKQLLTKKGLVAIKAGGKAI
jgi:large subunit ribosomal protein L5e